MTLAFTCALVDRENRDLRNAPTSTFTQISVVAVAGAKPAGKPVPVAPVVPTVGVVPAAA